MYGACGFRLFDPGIIVYRNGENVNCSKCGILEGAECLQRMLFAKNLPLCPALRREVDSGNPPNSSRSRKKGEGAGFPTP